MRRAGHDAAAARPERERMVFGEGALALERGHDRNLRELGQLEELGSRRVGVQDALAGVDDRLLRVQERAGCGLDVAALPAGAWPSPACTGARADRRRRPPPRRRRISTITGPPRPIFSRLKARRMTSRDLLGLVHTVSTHFVTDA
jgi:hypothetical protein